MGQLLDTLVVLAFVGPVAAFLAYWVARGALEAWREGLSLSAVLTVAGVAAVAGGLAAMILGVAGVPGVTGWHVGALMLGGGALIGLADRIGRSR